MAAGWISAWQALRGLVAGFVWLEPEYRRIFESETGPVARELERRAIRVHAQAVRNATGPRRPPPRPGGPGVVTGRGRSSIRFGVTSDQQGLLAFVGTDVHYMGLLETGQTRTGVSYPFLAPALEAARGG